MTEERMQFTPTDFDINALPAEAGEGSYEATCTKAKVGKTGSDGFPMLILEWTLTSAITGSDESVNAEVADFITFPPRNVKWFRMAATRVKALLDAMGISYDTLPTGGIEDEDSLQPLADAMQDRTATVYLTLKTDKRTGEERVNVGYTAPRERDADIDAPESTPATVAAKANGHSKGNGKSSNGKTVAAKNGKRR